MQSGWAKRITPECIVAILFGILYITIPTRMFYIDGVYYAEHLENIPYYVNGFHPHHLLYLPVMHALYDVCHSAIPSLRAMTFLLILSAVCGAITLFVFGYFLRKLGHSVFTRLSGMILLGSAYTFWHHSTDANIYIPAHLIVMIVILVIFSDGFFTSKPLQIIAGILLAFAGLMHEIALVALVPLSFYIYFKGEKERINLVLRFALSTILVILIAYPTVFSIYHGDISPTPGNFIRWTGAFTQAPHYFSYNEEHGGDIFQSTARGHTNAFFALKPLELILFDNATDDNIESRRMHRYLLMLTFISIAYYIGVVYRSLKGDKRITGVSIIFLFMLYFILTGLFMPGNHFYRIFYMPALITIWAGSVSSFPKEYRAVLKPVLIIALIVFFISNFSRGIFPEAKAWSNPYLLMTKQIDTFATNKDVVLFPLKDRYFAGIYRYFGNGDALHMQRGTYFVDIDSMYSEIGKYESETVKMLSNRYDRIFVTHDAFKYAISSRDDSDEIKPVIFTPNNYRLPHPKFMVVRPGNFKFVKWHKVWNEQNQKEMYYGEIEVEGN